MRERPILFSAPMVRALLDGSKSQTRRPVKNTGLYAIDARFHGEEVAARELVGLATQCPYGQPGDRLWVRETWANVGTMDPGLTVYRADYPACVPKEYQNVPPAESITWKPSIHMFRKASRITLEITGVRVERLQDISEADAVAEGVRISSQARRSDTCYGIYECQMPDGKTHFNDSSYDLYRILWEQINGREGPTSWAANPWVWIVEFERVSGMITEVK
jgi:hypothetical protein